MNFEKLVLVFCLVAFLPVCFSHFHGDELYCGVFPNSTHPAPSNFTSTSVCNVMNGIKGDLYFWDGGSGDKASDIAAIEDFVNGQIKVYADRLASLSPQPSCSSCQAWYQRYLCMVANPQPGASRCLFRKYWSGLRATSKCGSECANETTGLDPCDSTTQCCWCDVWDNITSSCATTLDTFTLSDDDINACNPVPQDFCRQTFALCLGLSTTNSKVVNTCSYFSKAGTSTPSWNLTTTTMPPTTECAAEFTSNFDVGQFSGSGLPILVPKNCQLQRVSNQKIRTCSKTSLTCRTRIVATKPYYTCSTGFVQQIAASVLVLALFLAFL
eukprot:TRINITY_DN2722_c0_g1_i1.p1 TRINITY_DN2722_c0_g1~~TRINITY_DN2722_c0_g1_i1.p1  ORF type:complete len:327 (-),score=77.38 TRINITY_DN2722_c0_g1_i1:162-1142(-)